MAISEHLHGYSVASPNRLNGLATLTEIGQAGIAKDVSPADYTSLPEFADIVGCGIVDVAQSKYRKGSSDQVYRTRHITACSGMILRDAEGSSFGLIHVSPLPFLDLADADFAALETFTGGLVVEIKGSGSTSKDHVLRQLRNRLGMRHTDTLEIPTRDVAGNNRAFHIALLPESNSILIARNSHQDVTTHPLFQ